MPATPAAVVHVVPGRPRRPRAGRVVLVILAAFGLAAIALNMVPGMGVSMPAPAHHVAARPKPPPPVHVTVGKTVYACTVVRPPANIKGRS